jgi:hypothetical protein
MISAELLKKQFELARLYNQQRKKYKYEKQKIEKQRVKDKKLFVSILQPNNITL